MPEIRQSLQYARYMSLRGWIVAKVPPFSLMDQAKRASIFVYIKKLPLIPFSVMKIQRSALPDFGRVERLARKHKSIFVIIEPERVRGMTPAKMAGLLQSYGYRRERRPLSPTLSLRLNLRLKPSRLLCAFKKDARSSIRKAQRFCKTKLIKLQSEKELACFYSAWKSCGRGYIPKFVELKLLLEAFKKKSFILAVYSRDDQLLAGTVILESRACASYYYAFTSPAGRRPAAGYLAVWKALLSAKRRGCTAFDLEGIFDRRYKFLRRWQGFSQFKKKFGGEEVLYPGSFVRYRVPLLGSFL